ncbi:MAG: toprim domain-containing protein, partial [Pseudomonadota bacterium]
RFRNRLMFPIRDQRGRCIAFGGRALSAEAQAKYLNSPETPLFQKGRTLYNLSRARAAAGKAGTVIVAEGYMDVIGLSQGGFGHATAPLGTAMTEDQLKLLWRMAEEPLIALDGDQAGLRAAWRVIDLALPHLAPGRSLGFCLMPEGRDPDDIVRDDGPTAMKALLDNAVPLVEMLWRREVAVGPIDTPERRAGFDKRLREALGRIADPSVRQHYAAAIRAKRAELFAPKPAPGSAGGGRAAAPGGGAPRFGMPARGERRFAGPGARRFGPPAGPRPETRSSAMAATAGPLAAEATARVRAATILLIAWTNPVAAATLSGAIEDLDACSAELDEARTATLERLLHSGAAEEAPPHGLLRVPQARAHPFARPGGTPAMIEHELKDLLERHALALAKAASLAECAAETA